MKGQRAGSAEYHCDDSQCDDKDGKKFDSGSKTYSKNVVYRLITQN